MSSIRLAIDVGSSKTAIYQVGAGVILCEPSLVAVSGDGRNSVYAVGEAAKRMVGKAAKGTTVFSPVVDGEIEKENVAKIMLDEFFRKIELSRFGTRVEAAVTVPCGTESAAVKKFRNLFSACGVNNVKFLESPVATAVGAGAPITVSNPCFVIDMGGNVTNIAAVSLDGVIAGVSANIGGNLVDNMLIDYVEESRSLRIGLQTAERIKREIGSLLPGDTTSTVINGRDVAGGNPRSMQIKACDVTEPIKLYVNKIYEIVSMVMAKLPPEVSAEIRNTGIYLSGGLSDIIGIEEYFYNEFSLPVKVNENAPLLAVLGAGRIMQNEKVYKRLKF
ncbi:MAG: rod shape-determining protein [Clostridia bacterium]|nr:rod shape-determining protein [Clostridia bacterium]